MCRSVFLRTLAVVAISILICAAQANAALVKVDLLGGLGEFEFSADTQWQMIAADGWPYGVKAATPQDSVAASWYRLTSLGVIPEQHTIFSIAPKTGISSSASQYMALKGTQGSIWLRKAVYVANDKPSELHAGDKLVYKIDRIYMPACKLPAGTTVQYKMGVNYHHTTTPVQTRVSVDLPIKTKPYSMELNLDVPQDAEVITLNVELTVKGNPGAAVPGIYIDGARLYRKNPNGVTFQMEQVPVLKNNRSINTHFLFANAKKNDTYAIAQDYDSVILQCEADYWWALRLKYYNPKMRVALYALTGAVSDYRTVDMVDPFYTNSPLSLLQVATTHPEWLYPRPAGFVPPSDSRPARLRDVPYLFEPGYNQHYYVDIANPQYQKAWESIVVDKIKRFRLDMVFADAVERLKPDVARPMERTSAEVQSFIHAVSPGLRKMKIENMVNCAVGDLLVAPYNTYFDPRWKANAQAAQVEGYRSNTAETTPDAFFQEWAFWRHWPVNGVDMNQYDLGYWNATLDNMDAIALWNKSMSAANKKKMYAQCHGVDRFDDPAFGPDGWIHFALCSFLLAQNEYTQVGFSRVGIVGDKTEVDLTGTARLGKAAGNRVFVERDGSLQTRAYSNGIVVVNGHPTQSRNYRCAKKIIDEDGAALRLGTSIVLPPRTGKMFFYK